MLNGRIAAHSPSITVMLKILDPTTLVNSIHHQNPMVRLRVVRALGGCGDVAITLKLLELAKASEPSVRLEVIKTHGMSVLLSRPPGSRWLNAQQAVRRPP